MNIKLMKKEHELSAIKLGRQGMLLKIAEMHEEIKRVEAQIAIQNAAIEKLEQEVEKLKKA